MRRIRLPATTTGAPLLALLLGILLPVAARAQQPADSTPRPLGVPTAEMRCRAIPVSAEDSTRGATNQYEFEIGDVRAAEERDLRASFDPQGRPVALIAMVTFASPARGIVFHGISARFGRGGDAIGVHARQAQSLATAAQPQPGAPPGGSTTKTLEALTPEEQREARELAAFLWTKRCN